MFNDKQPGYQQLASIVAERTNRIVLWIGAGLSRPAGLPSWATLRHTLCEALVNKAATGDLENQSRARKQAEQIENLQDMWLAFTRLRTSLGAATFRATIREALRAADDCPIPAIYLKLLDLPISGILSLNLDRLAARAYTVKYPGRNVVEFSGFQSGSHLHVLKGSTPFIANLHGISANESSWILTQDSMRQIQRDEGYRQLIRSCLATRTVVFLGISADDVTTGGHLEALTSDDKVDLGSHFWITDRQDQVTEEWAEKNQLQLIRYKATHSDHHELDSILVGLKTYAPKEVEAAPIVMAGTVPDANLPPPEQLAFENDPESLRFKLNAYAVQLLNESQRPAGDYTEYSAFTREYDAAIYRAWYVTNQPPHNKLFGYTIEGEIAEGAFGVVYRASDKNGRPVAIKLLREAVRRKPEMLQSFRRGVRSMRILADNNVDGMVPYEEASEIPAMAVMEFVEGPNLQEAVQAGYCNDWATVLHIGVQLANVVRRAHLLPQRVLHRDLRPPNIMLKDYYRDPAVPQVAILDFDLSWHMGSQELTVVNRSSMSGFLAPEQVIPESGMSTRNAAVDSFGLGMTLFYLRSGIEPQFRQHRDKNWENDLQKAILRYACPEWHSVPMRFARLILNCTQHEQARRWDMGQIEGELEQLRECLLNPNNVVSTELLLEELVQRVVEIGGYPRYLWDADKVRALVDIGDGIELTVTANESERNVVVGVEWSSQGTRKYEAVRKYLKPALDKAISTLKSKGWFILPSTYKHNAEAGFKARLSSDRLAQNLPAEAKEITNILTRFNFS